MIEYAYVCVRVCLPPTHSIVGVLRSMAVLLGQLIVTLTILLWQVQFMSLEKEVFPFMAQDGQLFAFDLEGLYTLYRTHTLIRVLTCTYIHVPSKLIYRVHIPGMCQVLTF